MKCQAHPPPPDTVRELIEYLPPEDRYLDQLKRIFGYGTDRKYFAGHRRFRNGPNAYDPYRAWWLCEASWLVYDTPERCRTELAKQSFDEALVLGEPDVEVILARRGGEAFVIFPGTDITRPVSLMRNMDPRTMKRGRFQFHRGYLKKFLALKKKHRIDTWIFNLPIGTKVFFAGHSAGGSCAVIAAHYFCLDRLLDAPDVTVYTFGSAGAVNSMAVPFRLFRVEGYRDPIPHMPPFRHSKLPGIRIVVGCNDPRVKSPPPSLFEPGRALRALLQRRRPIEITAEWLTPILDHSLAVYAARLRYAAHAAARN